MKFSSTVQTKTSSEWHPLLMLSIRGATLVAEAPAAAVHAVLPLDDTALSLSDASDVHQLFSRLAIVRHNKCH